MAQSIRVIQFGLGAIGRAAARLCLERPHLQLVGAIDNAPGLIGQDLGMVLGLKKRLGVTVSDKPAVVFAQAGAEAVIHCTTSRFPAAYEQFTEIGRAGLHCVSSCEEALFPAARHAPLVNRLNQLCQERGVAMLGTGVNPGFVMDTLPALLTAVCQRVERVRVVRIVDAGTRREALQRKVGAGLTRTEFKRRVKAGQLGHAGLVESLLFVADALGWTLDKVDDTTQPALAPRHLKTSYFSIRKGGVTGLQQVARGYRGKRAVLTLELQMYVGARRPADVIEIDGAPPLRLVIEGGTPGDIATPAMLVNCLPRLVKAPPGWHTMKTIGLVSCRT